MSADAHETHHASILGATGAGVASVPTVDAAAVLSREALARRVALLEGLLREVQPWLNKPWGDDTPAALKDLMRRVMAALADGG